MINGVKQKTVIGSDEYVVLENIRPRHKAKCCVCLKEPEKVRIAWMNWKHRSYPMKKIYCLEHGISFLRECQEKFKRIEKNMLKIASGDLNLENEFDYLKERKDELAI